MARPLSTDLCRRLARLLPLLASDQPGEVAATAAAITRALKLAERDWHDLAATITLVSMQSAPPPQQSAPPPKQERAIDSAMVGDLIEDIYASGCYLTDKAKGFLSDLEDRASRYALVYFSTRQWEWFVAILDKAGIDEAVD